VKQRLAGRKKKSRLKLERKTTTGGVEERAGYKVTRNGKKKKTSTDLGVEGGYPSGRNCQSGKEKTGQNHPGFYLLKLSEREDMSTPTKSLPITQAERKGRAV